MKITIRITDKFLLRDFLDKEHVIVEFDGKTLKDLIDLVIMSRSDIPSHKRDPKKLFASFLFIHNGIKVIGYDEYEKYELMDGDTVIIAPVVAGG